MPEVVVMEQRWYTITVPDDVLAGCITGHGESSVHFTSPERKPGEAWAAYCKRVVPSNESCRALLTYGNGDAPETEMIISEVDGVEVDY